MKKFLLLLVIFSLLASIAVVPAFAGPGKGNVKGQVESIDLVAGTLTVKTKSGDTVLVIFPAGFDPQSIQVGDSVLVKGTLQSDDSIQAVSIKQVGGAGEENGFGKRNSAYCAEGKQVKPHPVATRINERFGVTEEWVMEYFCNGYGMGAILLALKTSQKDPSLTPEALLVAKASGKGWGQIWREAGLVGNEKEAVSPPGFLKKSQENPGNPDKGPKKEK